MQFIILILIVVRSHREYETHKHTHIAKIFNRNGITNIDAMKSAEWNFFLWIYLFTQLCLCVCLYLCSFSSTTSSFIYYRCKSMNKCRCFFSSLSCFILILMLYTLTDHLHRLENQRESEINETFVAKSQMQKPNHVKLEFAQNNRRK